MKSDRHDQLAKTAARDFQGEFAWVTVLLGIVVLSAFVATPFLVVKSLLPLWAGCAVMAGLTYLAYTVMHESVHGAISGNNLKLRWINEWMGYASAFVLMIPLTIHRHEHLAHHRSTNDPTDDPDVPIGEMTRSPLHAIRAVVRVNVQQYRHYFKTRWGKGPVKQDRTAVTEMTVAIGARIAFLAQGYWYDGVVLWVAGGLGGLTALIYLFAYLVHRPHTEVGRYVDTSTILPPQWCASALTVMWMFQNYHAIHHLFPRVPFYRYRQLFEKIRPAMEANDAPIYELTLAGLKRSLPAEQPLVLA